MYVPPAVTPRQTAFWPQRVLPCLVWQSQATTKVSLFTNECTSDFLVNVFKNNIKIYNKIVRTCFGVITPSSGRATSVLAEVTLVTIVTYGTSVCD